MDDVSGDLWPPELAEDRFPVWESQWPPARPPGVREGPSSVYGRQLLGPRERAWGTPPTSACGL